MSRTLCINKRQRLWHAGWFRLFILGWIVVCSASCTQAIKDRLFKKEVAQGSGQESTAHGRISSCPSCSRLQRALRHLQAGENETAREILKELSREGGTSHVGPAAEFYLGVIKLFQTDDLHGMEVCKSYFQGYIEKYPTELYRANAVRIVHMLERQIKRTRKLNRVVEDQAREIRTLKYQMQKLEEIQQDTERKRQSLELEGEE